VEPQRRRAGQDTDAVLGPHRVVVGDALGVVPHAVAVDDVPAGLLGDLEHPAVDVRGHTTEHVLRRLPHPLRPVLLHEVVVAADTAGGHDDGSGGELEVPDDGAGGRHAARRVGGFEDRPTHTGGGSVGVDVFV